MKNFELRHFGCAALLTCTVIFSTGCVTTSKTTTPGVVEVEYTKRLRSGQTINGSTDEIQIFTQSHRAQMGALDVATAVFTLGTSLIDMATTDKTDYRGRKIKDVTDRSNLQTGISTDFIATLESRLNQHIADSPELSNKIFSNPVYVANGRSILIYDDFSEDDELFKLHQDIEIYKTAEKGNKFFSIPKSVRVGCHEVSEEPLHLSTWSADNYLLAQETVQKWQSQCIEKVIENADNLLNQKK